MTDISTEQKLQLVQQIRSQYNKNQYDMSNRERILYGRTSGNTSNIASYPEKQYNFATEYSVNDIEKKASSESFKMRCILAAMLVVFALLFDVLEIKPLGIEMEQIFQIIAENNIK